MRKKEPEKKSHQVFISYSNEKGDNTSPDRKIADMICSALESENIRCWIDHRDIMPGEKWVNAMFNAVEKSKVMVLVFSANANRSQWVEDEITYALDENITIIPFRVEDVSPQGALRVLRVRSQWIDAHKMPGQEGLNRLVSAVSTHLEKDREKPVEVIDVESTPKKVYENEKGFREADLGDGIIMVYIPPGEFKMGSDDYDDEKPPHTVYLDGYWLGKTQVTVKQFKLFVDDTGYATQAETGGGAYTWTGVGWEQKENINWKNPGFKQDDNHPVVCVSWNDAVEYCKWLSDKKGVHFKLPTEAKWEKAARGTDARKYPWGDQEPGETLANFDMNIKKTTVVGSYPKGASPYGLLDMAGNAWEWCWDWYSGDYYQSSPHKNPTGPESGPGRVVRGGSWHSSARYLRCANRGSDRPSNRSSYLGFRLSQDN